MACVVALPTSGGVRKSIDLGANSLNLQPGIEAPNATLNEVGNRHGPQLLASIFQNLSSRGLACSFEEINLSDNYIGDEGAAHLLKGLGADKKPREATPACGETTTNLLGNFFGGGNTATFQPEVIEEESVETGQTKSCVVKKVFCQRSQIGAAGFGSLGNLLAVNDSIEELVLDNNPCGKMGLAGDFSAGLSTNKTLRSLRLGSCRLGSEGIRPLCDGPLKVHPKLEHLELMYNRIDIVGVKYLNAVWNEWTALRYLDLSANALGPDGAVALAEGLKAGKGQLQKLSVAQNMIKFEGTKALALYFNSPEGRKMEYMDLRFNILSHRGFVEMRKLLGRNMDEEDSWLLMFGTRQLFMNAH